MTTTMIGLSVAPQRDKLYQVQCNTSSLVEGAAVIWDSADAIGSVKAPTAALNNGFAGLIADVLPSGGTTAGNKYNIQRTGVGMGLIATGVSVTVGDYLVIADTSGTLRSYNDGGGDDNCEIIGIALQTLTAGSATDMIKVDLDTKSRIDKS